MSNLTVFTYIHYVCINSYVQLNNYAFIHIFPYHSGPPSVALSSTNMDAIEGHEMTLTCTATNNAESPYDANIAWYGPTGQVIKYNENITVTNIKIGTTLTSTLKFNSINHKQTGINKCRASNHLNSSNEVNFTITVQCKSHKFA